MPFFIAQNRHHMGRDHGPDVRAMLRHRLVSRRSIIGAIGFDTLSLFTCQSPQSTIFGPIKINLSERYNGKMASSPPLLN